MRNLALLLLAGAFVVPVYCTVELCPVGLERGSEDCYEVDEVFLRGEWLMACCSRVETPKGYRCVDSNCAEKGPVSKLPELTRFNAYVLFGQGYMTWVVVDGEVHHNYMGKGFDMETIRSYLPMARQWFLDDPKLEKFSVVHSGDILIVIKRPEDDSDLEEEIVFPTRVSAEELEKYLKNLDDGMLRVYPNPADKEVKVSFENNVHIAKIEVISLEGKVLKCDDYSRPVNKATVALDDLDPGNYLLRLTDVSGRSFSRPFNKR